METAPFFSVITATHNSVNELPRCIESVAGQTFARVEHLVIDGDSDDGTVEVLKDYEKHLASWVSEPDEGIYDAWNKGVSLARGTWILFLGADDRLADKNVLEDIRRAIREYGKEPPFVYGQVSVVTSKKEREIVRFGKPWEEMRDEYKGIKPAVSSNASTFYHRSLFEEGARFDTSYRIAADYKFVLETLLKTEEEPLYADRLVAVMRTGGASSRPGTRKFREELRMLRELNIEIPIERKIRIGIRSYGKAMVYRLLGPRLFGRLANAWRRVTKREPIWDEVQ